MDTHSKKVNLILFSGEYDKALAALILANAAREIGAEVTVFCAFWGLFLLRDPERMTSQDKTLYEGLFGALTPVGPDQLPLSRMNIAGLGKQMLLAMMQDEQAPTLKEFLEGARRKGVRFYGCKLSADVMGFQEEELLPGVEIVTATDYLKDALEAEVQLFI